MNLFYWNIKQMKEKIIIFVHRPLKSLNIDDKKKVTKRIYRTGEDKVGYMERNKNLICIKKIFFPDILDARTSDPMLSRL